MFDRISVIGAGGWGTALAALLAENRPSVRLWAHHAATADRLRAERVNTDYLPGVRIPDQVEVTNDLALAANADLLVVVVPSRALRGVAGRLATAGLPDDAVLVSCTKGIEHDTGYLMTQVLEDCLPGRRLAVLSGPNLAAEIARRIPAAGVIGSRDAAILPELQELFSFATFRTYTTDDVEGIQLGGALKNVFAIAAGASDGLGMGDNAKAALVTRALAEMMRLGASLGGRRETFSGLSGIGDLMVTCFSKHSRNRGFGERLGRGETAEQIQASMKMVAEGVPTARSALQCARRLGVEAPIIAQVHAVLYEGRSPRDAMWELLVRPPKRESDDSQA
ncbi:MAG: NAD(P)-dependent glycerol-3-phosphate dehydrogenase [Terrimicrobiaceae bacterium]|nr:NAD(P)-dependent glycerol-3-phosphate dehydrogenase [Terrimicrobiaceae bacterium]